MLLGWWGQRHTGAIQEILLLFRSNPLSENEAAEGVVGSFGRCNLKASFFYK